ncbi:GH3 auxin-responsive promoter [compost metagenome]
MPYHEWLIEFENEPENILSFAEAIDDSMRKQNIYYDDLITGNVLQKVVVTKVSKNGFQDYMKSQGKLGGQNKLPRLSNNRDIADNLK